LGDAFGERKGGAGFPTRRLIGGTASARLSMPKNQKHGKFQARDNDSKTKLKK